MKRLIPALSLRLCATSAYAQVNAIVNTGGRPRGRRHHRRRDLAQWPSSDFSERNLHRHGKRNHHRCIHLLLKKEEV